MRASDRRTISIFGAGGAALCLIALAFGTENAHAALLGWLAAFAFASAVPFGGLCLALVLRIVPGEWRKMLQPQADWLMLAMPLLVILVMPILLGMPHIYPWATDTGLTGFKSVYLTPIFFIIRTLVILCGTSLLGLVLCSGVQEKTPIAVGGLITFVIFQGLLATDWLMSLDPEFHSSGFGLYVLASQVLTGFSALAIVRLFGGMERQVRILGPLLLTLLLLWAYFAFMQYFILWSGNLPPGVSWYQRRGETGWAVVEYVMAASRLLPAFLLLFPPVRRDRRLLIALAMITLAGSPLEYAWLVLPSLEAGMGVALLSFGFSLIGMLLLYPLAIMTSMAIVTSNTRRTR